MGLGQINTNLAALKAYNQLTMVNNNLQIHQQRIATGKKVEKAGDDPAGYYMARVYERNISVIQRNMDHVETATAQLQVEDAKMSQVVKLLQSVEDLVLQGKSELITSAQKSAIKAEIDQLVAEVASVVTGLTNLSGISVGADLTVSVTQTQVSTGGLGILSGSAIKIEVATATNISNALSILSAAITTMLQREEKVGAYITRLEAKGDAYAVDMVNKRAQKSVIEDADLAAEQLQATKYQILQQSALAMLAQANVSPQSMLRLIV